MTNKPTPAQSAEDIQRAVAVLRKGGVILYPTDTIWGIGCDATNEAAVRRVYEIKRRADSKSLIVLVDSADRMQRYVRDVPEVAWQLVDALGDDSPSPTTLVLDGAVNLAPNLISDDGSIGIRITHEAFSRELCYRFQRALVSTSANFSGDPSPRTFADIPEELKAQVDYVCTSRQRDTRPGNPSKIIKLGRDGVVKVIR